MEDISQTLSRTLQKNLQEKKAQQCSCNRQDQVRYYCAQENCEKHKNDIFFCDQCFESIMEEPRKHTLFPIMRMQSVMDNGLVQLIERERKMYECVSRQGNNALIAYLEQQKPANAPLNQLETIHTDFTHYLSLYQQSLQQQDFRKLQEFNQRQPYFAQQIEKGQQMADSIANEEFIYEKYSDRIQKCLIPLNDSVLAQSVIEMKLKLGKQLVQEEEEKMHRPIGPDQILEEMNDMKHSVNQLKAQIHAFICLFGGLEGASQLIKRILNSQQSINLLNESLQREEYKSEQYAEPPIHSLYEKPIQQYNMASITQGQPETPYPPFVEQKMESFLEEWNRLSREIAVQEHQKHGVSYLFTQEKLEQVKQQYDQNKVTPGREPALTELVNMRGWKWSLEELNAKADIYKQVNEAEFEGL
ncbi:hypothetical protein FGO68_gene13983 [Halteria grandinella]|uniref:Uncharacterized protein n=1 Tax=Halteria grandinella TaxID=5974 RepID=A0A8J8T3I4_HALGN|nr:hypothetical protein FGO68_gene13983 [Halteria grandinella]